MRLPKNPLIKKWNYLAFAFGIPFFCFCFVLILGGYEPFGNGRALLYSDQYHQYYPFFVSFRNALRSGDSLLYNWEYGMGIDHLGLISYYLGSPLNLLSVLVPESLLLEYFCLLTPLKLGFAGLFFGLFLKKLFRRNDLSIALFGAFYALCAWALGYQWNVMWLDTFALLPLVALGTVSLLRDKKCLLYTVSLFLSVAINYYIGLFTCIFVLLLFICYQLCRCRSIMRFLADLIRIGFFTVLALGATAFITLPAYAALQTTQSSVNNFPQGFRLNIATKNTWEGLLDAMRQVAGNMGGGLTPTWKEGLPNLYCGVGSVFLAMLFLTSGQVKFRDKLCSVALLLFFMVSFISRKLDYIWHGFHFTNMIPYRFSFLFSFVILYMAYRAYLERKRFRLWQILVAAVLSAGIFYCSDFRTDLVYLAYNGIFLALYVGISIYCICHKKPPVHADHERRKIILENRKLKYEYATFGLAGILAVELIINTVNFGVSFPYTSVSNYPKGTRDSANVIHYMQKTEQDSLFYRTEVTHSQTLNDGALNHYNGISTFTSSANVRVTEFMKALGYGAKNTYNRYCFEESSPISNLFLNLKYMVDRDGQEKDFGYFREVYRSGVVKLLENEAYLPLGFLTDIQMANLDFASVGNTITFQNRLLRAASGIEEDAWYKIPKEYVTVTGDNVSVLSSVGGGYCSYSATQAGTLTYLYTANRNGFLCIDLNLPKKNSYSVWVNGVKLYDETYSLPQCLAVADVIVGDVVEIRLNCKAGDRGGMTVEAAILDEAVFRKAYEILAASTLDVTHFSNTRIEGTILCDRDGLMYTSIPQDGNWQVTVDGNAVEPVLVGKAMVGVPLTEGEHTVVFVYKNKAFSMGWTVSLGCVLVFALVAWIQYKPLKNKGKYEK